LDVHKDRAKGTEVNLEETLLLCEHSETRASANLVDLFFKRKVIAALGHDML
jgi:hypothetical protein